MQDKTLTTIRYHNVEERKRFFSNFVISLWLKDETVKVNKEGNAKRIKRYASLNPFEMVIEPPIIFYEDKKVFRCCLVDREAGTLLLDKDIPEVKFTDFITLSTKSENVVSGTSSPAVTELVTEGVSIDKLKEVCADKGNLGTEAAYYLTNIKDTEDYAIIFDSSNDFPKLDGVISWIFNDYLFENIELALYEETDSDYPTADASTVDKLVSGIVTLTDELMEDKKVTFKLFNLNLLNTFYGKEEETYTASREEDPTYVETVSVTTNYIVRDSKGNAVDLTNAKLDETNTVNTFAGVEPSVKLDELGLTLTWDVNLSETTTANIQGIIVLQDGTEVPYVDNFTITVKESTNPVEGYYFKDPVPRDYAGEGISLWFELVDKEGNSISKDIAQYDADIVDLTVKIDGKECHISEHNWPRDDISKTQLKIVVSNKSVGDFNLYETNIAFTVNYRIDENDNKQPIYYSKVEPSKVVYRFEDKYTVNQNEEGKWTAQFNLVDKEGNPTTVDNQVESETYPVKVQLYGYKEAYGGEYLITGSIDDKVWSVENGQSLLTITFETDNVEGFDGKTIFSGAYSVGNNQDQVPLDAGFLSWTFDTDIG